MDSTPEFSPPDFTQINLRYVDVILISNYRTMLALPYVTERSDFAGVVYATEPSIILGRLYMVELITYVGRNPKLKRATAWKAPNVWDQLPFAHMAKCGQPSTWETIFSLEEVESSLAKVKPVSFAEKIVRG